MKLFFVIPAFNEAENIPSLIDSLRTCANKLAFDYQILLIDDGSSDDTSAVTDALSAKFPILLIKHPQNLGPGAAFCTGLNRALDLCTDKDRIVTLEADNTSDLSILPALLDLANQGIDAALASVYAPGGGIVGAAWYRHFLSWGANQLLSLTIGTSHIHTYSSFFRVYRPTALKQLVLAYAENFIAEPGFVCKVELLMKLHLLGCSLAEVPMILDSKKRIGSSKMRIGRTINRYLFVIRNYLRGGYRPRCLPTTSPFPTTR